MLLPSTHALRYLWVVTEKQHCRDQAVHHLLISLCAEQYTKTNKKQQSNDSLMTYLESASPPSVLTSFAGQVNHTPCLDSFNLAVDHHQPDLNTPLPEIEQTANLLNACAPQFVGLDSVLPYDPGFVLRTCKEVGHLRGTVFILSLLGMHQQALNTAIEQENITLAKEIAQNETLQPEVRRQLWLRIAKHVIGKQSNMSEATNLLRECPLLKLEDILPYFDEFVTIDQFKDAICTSLDSYHQRIEEVKREMHVTMQSTSALRTQLDGLRYRYEELDVQSRCIHCHHWLLSRAFYVFSCGHYFHANCLLELIQSQLSSTERRELNELMHMQTSDNQASPIDLQAEIDHIIADDCATCGRRAIDSVADLFFKDQASYESELSIWQ